MFATCTRGNNADSPDVDDRGNVRQQCFTLTRVAVVQIVMPRVFFQKLVWPIEKSFFFLSGVFKTVQSIRVHYGRTVHTRTATAQRRRLVIIILSLPPLSYFRSPCRKNQPTYTRTFDAEHAYKTRHAVCRVHTVGDDELILYSMTTNDFLDSNFGILFLFLMIHYVKFAYCYSFVSRLYIFF